MRKRLALRTALAAFALILLGACTTAPPAPSTTARPQPQPIADNSLPPVVRPEATPRERIIDIAQQEWRRWGSQVVSVTPEGACVTTSSLPPAPEYLAARAAADAGLVAQPCLRYADGSGMEASPSGCALALRYWHLLGRDPDCMEITEPRWAWSAAFISWVMRQAGLTEAQFLTGQSHSMYVADARDGILPQGVFGVEAFPALPVAGDMICSARGAPGVLTPHDVVFAHTPMHCDIVIEVDAAARVVRAIGGNVQQSVSLSVIHWDEAGAAPTAAPSALPQAPAGVDTPPDESAPPAHQPWLLVMRYHGAQQAVTR